MVRLAITLLVVWLVAWLFFKALGALVHLLLVVAAVLFIAGLVRRGARKAGV